MPEELIAARQLHWRHTARPILRYAMYAILTVSFVMGISYLIDGDDSAAPLIFIGAPLYIIFLRTGTQRIIARRQFKSRPDAGATVTTEFEDDRIRSRSSMGDSAEAGWTSFHKAVIGEGGVLLYLNPQLFQWYPRKAFSDDSQFRNFVDLVRRRVGKCHDA